VINMAEKSTVKVDEVKLNLIEMVLRAYDP
jgi:coenzyme F420-reducing hydrogenase alpha subunit